MMVMVPYNCNRRCFGWAADYPGQFGFLTGPSYYKKTPIRPGLPYAADNDAYKAFREGMPWDEAAFFKMLTDLQAAPQPPLWVAVPDVVADKTATLANWEKYHDRIAGMGFALRFVVQDGMTLADVPKAASGVFVGGSTAWKWRTAPQWCRHYSTHIGRINNLELLLRAEQLGAESIDGSGWHRREPHRWSENFDGLEAWLKGWKSNQIEMSL